MKKRTVRIEHYGPIYTSGGRDWGFTGSVTGTYSVDELVAYLKNTLRTDCETYKLIFPDGQPAGEWDVWVTPQRLV